METRDGARKSQPAQTCYNSMLQPFVIRQSNTISSCQTGTAPNSNDVGYLSYTFSPSQNNGNVTGQAIHYGASGTYLAMDFQQTYTYTDPSTSNVVSRLISATESRANHTPWTQQFNYDLVGNRWLNLGGMQIDPMTPTANWYDGNNHLTTAGYNDGRGNVTQLGGYAYQYDAENRLISSALVLNGLTLASATYSYDGDGRRVVKQSGGTTTHYVYDVQGNLVVEQTVAGTATPMPCTTCYLMADHLGSTRMLTDASGTQKALYGYAPFGEELTTQNGRDARWGGPGSGLHFTGMEQEGYEGDYLHYFGARYYSGGLGRFMSADGPLVDQDESDPQSWNLYTYARNNPLRFVDPTGRECVTLDNGAKGDDGTGTFCSEVAEANKNKKPDVTVTGSPEPATWAQYFGLDWAYRRAINQQIEIDAKAGRWGKIPILRGEMPIGHGEVAEATNVLKSIWSNTNRLSAVRNAFLHWMKHGGEFSGLQNAKQYVEEAAEFVTHPPAGTLSKLRANGDTVLYNPETNTFAVKTAAGAPRTMFKPSGNGMAYFNGQ
jgi:RHS repeat-associated protein